MLPAWEKLCLAPVRRRPILENDFEDAGLSNHDTHLADQSQDLLVLSPIGAIEDETCPKFHTNDICRTVP